MSSALRWLTTKNSNLLASMPANPTRSVWHAESRKSNRSRRHLRSSMANPSELKGSLPRLIEDQLQLGRSSTQRHTSLPLSLSLHPHGGRYLPLAGLPDTGIYL